jgi:hypothetical protein
MQSQKVTRYTLRESIESIEEEEYLSSASTPSNKFGSKNKILRNSSSLRMEDGLKSRGNFDLGKISELIEEKM